MTVVGVFFIWFEIAGLFNGCGHVLVGDAVTIALSDLL